MEQNSEELIIRLKGFAPSSFEFTRKLIVDALLASPEVGYAMLDDFAKIAARLAIEGNSQDCSETTSAPPSKFTWNWQSIGNFLEFCNVPPDNLTAFASGVSAITTDGRHIEAIVFRDHGRTGIRAIVPVVAAKCPTTTEKPSCQSSDRYDWVSFFWVEGDPVTIPETHDTALTCDVPPVTSNVVEQPDDEHAAMERFFFGR